MGPSIRTSNRTGRRFAGPAGSLHQARGMLRGPKHPKQLSASGGVARWHHQADAPPALVDADRQGEASSRLLQAARTKPIRLKMPQLAPAPHRQRWLNPVSRMRNARSVSATTAAKSRPLVHAARGSARRLHHTGRAVGRVMWQWD